MRDLMTKNKQREIVIEFEKVQLIRKRAKTILKYCEGCNAESDFVGLRLAADLFDITDGDLTSFVISHAVHCNDENSRTNICITSLLTIMHAKHGGNGRGSIVGGISGCDNRIDQNNTNKGLS